MQNAKDSFYKVLRDRLAVLNPDRTTVVRGVTRPAILVDENETTNVAAMGECFHLRWTGAETATFGVYPLVALHCEVKYSTMGSAWNGGLDRGRVLATMDAELMAAVGQYPQNAVKDAYSAPAQGGVATAMASRIWWSNLSFGPVQLEADRLTRTAAIEVMSLEEGGEQ